MYRACKYACLIENEAVWYPRATRFSDLSISSYTYNSGVHPLFHLPFAVVEIKHVFVILRKFQVSKPPICKENIRHCILILLGEHKYTREKTHYRGKHMCKEIHYISLM